MIVDQVIGRSFVGVLKYAILKDEASLVLSSLSSNHINHMAYEFMAVCEQCPNLTRNVSHKAFSPNQLDNMTDEQIFDFVNAYREKMGSANTPFVLVKHEDTDNTHYHLIESRVTFDGEVVSDQNNYARNSKVTRELEKAFDLTVTKRNPDADKTPKHQRDAEFSQHRYIKDSLDCILASSPTTADFEKSLSSLDIETNVRYDSKGKSVGVSFSYQDYAVSGTKVGYKISTLNKLGIQYEPRTDTPAVESALDTNKNGDAQRDFTGGRTPDDSSSRMERQDKRNAREFEPEASGLTRFFQRIKSTIDNIRGGFERYGNLRSGLHATENSCRKLDEAINTFNNTVKHELKQKELNILFDIDICTRCKNDPCACNSARSTRTVEVETDLSFDM